MNEDLKLLYIYVLKYKIPIVRLGKQNVRGQFAVVLDSSKGWVPLYLTLGPR
jgi:hypothetical protein